MAVNNNSRSRKLQKGPNKLAKGHTYTAQKKKEEKYSYQKEPKTANGKLWNDKERKSDKRVGLFA